MAPTPLTVAVGGVVVVALHARKAEVYGLLELLRQVQGEDSLEFVIDELLRRGQRRLLVGECSSRAEPEKDLRGCHAALFGAADEAVILGGLRRLDLHEPLLASISVGWVLGAGRR